MMTALRLVLSVGLTGWQALVGKTLWAWFVVPAFPAAPVLSILQAWGLVLTLSMFSGDHLFVMDAVTTANASEREAIGWNRLLMGGIGPFLALMIGFAVKKCM